jgi:hypothetical protein
MFPSVKLKKGRGEYFFAGENRDKKKMIKWGIDWKIKLNFAIGSVLFFQHPHSAIRQFGTRAHVEVDLRVSWG